MLSRHRMTSAPRSRVSLHPDATCIWQAVSTLAGTDKTVLRGASTRGMSSGLVWNITGASGRSAGTLIIAGVDFQYVQLSPIVPLPFVLPSSIRLRPLDCSVVAVKNRLLPTATICPCCDSVWAKPSFVPYCNFLAHTKLPSRLVFRRNKLPPPPFLARPYNT